MVSNHVGYLDRRPSPLVRARRSARLSVPRICSSERVTPIRDMAQGYPTHAANWHFMLGRHAWSGRVVVRWRKRPVSSGALVWDEAGGCRTLSRLLTQQRGWVVATGAPIPNPRWSCGRLSTDVASDSARSWGSVRGACSFTLTWSSRAGGSRSSLMDASGTGALFTALHRDRMSSTGVRSSLPTRNAIGELTKSWQPTGGWLSAVGSTMTPRRSLIGCQRPFANARRNALQQTTRHGCLGNSLLGDLPTEDSASTVHWMNQSFE